MAQLILVPTPIGNLEDITLRALKALRDADAVLAEDTRTTGILLKHHGIEAKKLIAYHLKNEHKILERIVSELKSGLTYALATDSGTPSISDPGFLLVRECVRNDIEVSCLPGPTAFVPALVMSGFPCDRFVYLGFAPHKKGRQTFFKELAAENRTIVFYESPHRLLKTLTQLAESLPEARRIAVCRELSKKFEEVLRGTSKEMLAHFEVQAPRGEFVIAIEAES